MSTKHHGRNPNDASNDVIKNEGGPFHFHDACNDGRESADDGKELCKEDRSLSIFMIKFCSAQQVIFAKEPRFFSFIKQWTRGTSKPVAYNITEYRCNGHHNNDHRVMHSKKLVG